MNPSLPFDEDARLNALRAYRILDTPPEPEYDRLVELASNLTGMPVAVLSLIDDKRQWFKARRGIHLTQTSRCSSLCAYAILGDELLVIPDTRLDPRAVSNPFVQGDPKLRFYAGAPLTTPDGHRLGTLCVMDFRPRRLSPPKRRVLQQLAAIAVDALQLRRTLNENRHLSTVVEDGFTAVITLDPFQPDRPITYANAAFLKMTGYRREEILGRSPLLLRGPETDPGTIQLIRAAIAEERVYQGRVVCYRRDGTKFSNALTAKPVFDPQGKLLHYVGLQKNVTEQERMEEALRLGRTNYRQAAANEPGMMFQWVTYRDGTPREFRFVSEGCRRLFGVDPSAFAREPDFLFYHLSKEDRAGFVRSLAEASATLSPWQWHGRMLTPEQPAEPEKWVVVKGRPTRLPGGDLLWDGVVADAASDSPGGTPPPETQVSMPTGPARDALLWRAALEPQAPLVTILDPGHRLESHPGPEEDQGSVRRILATGRELLKTMDAMNHQASGSSGPRLHTAQTVVPLEEVVRDTLEIIRPLADEHGIQLREPTFPFAPQSWHVAAERHGLQQVLLNLFSNAVYYSCAEAK